MPDVELARPRIPGVRVVAIAQARMGSSRLPGKVLERAGTRSILAHLVRRLQLAETLDDLVIATTDRPGDDALEAEARRLGARVHRGPEHDVLRRYTDAARAAGADVVVRVTGDCPLLDPRELDRVVTEFLSRRGTPAELDYLTNQDGEVRRVPRGYDVEVASSSALERADREATDPGDREHVMPWLRAGRGGCRALVTHPEGVDGGHLRVTVDTAQDLAAVRAIVDALGEDAGLAEVVAYLGRHPEVAALNATVSQRTATSEGELRRRWIGATTIVGRADAGTRMGVGHVTRLEGILGAWVAHGGRAVLRASGVDGALAERLRATGIELEGASTRGDEADLEDTLALIGRLRAAAIAIDGYAFDDAFLGRLRAAAPLLAFADDEATLARERADVVVALSAISPSTARVLTGPSYAPLRAGVLARIDASAPAEPPRVLVSLGGADPARLTGPVATRLAASLPPRTRLVVVLGGASGPAPPELAALPTDRCEVVRDAPELAEVLAGATLAVLAAGSTTWEAMALGVPAVLLEVAPNQRGVVATAIAVGAAIGAGQVDASAPARVATAVEALLADEPRRSALALAGRRAVDGRGPARILDALGEVIAARRPGSAPPRAGSC